MLADTIDQNGNGIEGEKECRYQDQIDGEKETIGNTKDDQAWIDRGQPCQAGKEVRHPSLTRIKTKQQ